MHLALPPDHLLAWVHSAILGHYRAMGSCSRGPSRTQLAVKMHPTRGSSALLCTAGYYPTAWICVWCSPPPPRTLVDCLQFVSFTNKVIVSRYVWIGRCFCCSWVDIQEQSGWEVWLGGVAGIRLTSKKTAKPFFRLGSPVSPAVGSSSAGFAGARPRRGKGCHRGCKVQTGASMPLPSLAVQFPCM